MKLTVRRRFGTGVVMRWAVLGVLILGVLGCFGLGAEGVLAADCGEGEVATNIIGSNGCATTGEEGDGIFMILNIVLTIMTIGVGILGTVGLVIAAIMYLTARDNEGQAAKAKTRIFEIVIGLAIWVVMYAALKFLIPGFNY